MSVEASLSSSRAAPTSSSGVPKSASSNLANSSKQIQINSPVKPNAQHHLNKSSSHNDFKFSNSTTASINFDDFKAVCTLTIYVYICLVPTCTSS